MELSTTALVPPVFESGANIIGGIFGAVGLYEFIKGLVPSPPKGVTNVGVAVGQTADNPEKDDPYNLAGNIPAISVYSVAGNLVASSKGDKKKTWKAGSKNSVSMENNAGQDSVGSEYISVVATGTNAICISAVGLKNPNDEVSYGWFSDVGVSCGMQFHWSETVVAMLERKDTVRIVCGSRGQIPRTMSRLKVSACISLTSARSPRPRPRHITIIST